MKEVLAVAALTVSLSANVPYIYDIVRGKVEPERVSWLLWTLLGGVFFISTLVDEGATLFTLAEVIAPVVIFSLSLKYGVGGKSRFDLISLTVALIALSLLFVLDGALTSLLLALSVDGIGVMLTVRKLLLDPTSETKLAWGMSAISGLLALLSLENYSLVAAIYPAYVVVVCTIIWYLAHPGKPHPEKIEEL